MAQMYYYRHYHFYPSVVDVKANGDGTFSVHLYEMVSNGDGTFHTATAAGSGSSIPIKISLVMRIVIPEKLFFRIRSIHTKPLPVSGYILLLII